MEKLVLEKDDIGVYDLFPPDEGSIQLYYGRIGSGKTFALTKELLDDLESGKIVYSNWKVDFEGFDERLNIISLIFGFFGFKRKYINIPRENFHYVDLRNFKGGEFTDWLASLTDCVIYIDEGHTVLNSYERTDISRSKQNAITFTRHFDRTIKIASQRWQNIHVQARANVNMFVKCEKIFKFGSIVRFRVSEYQDLDSLSAVDETNPTDVRHYWGSSRIFKAYNTKYLRGNLYTSQMNLIEIWKLKRNEIWSLLKVNKLNRKVRLSDKLL